MAPPPLRWSMTLSSSADEGGRAVTLADGEALTLGGDAPLARVTVSPRGSVDVVPLVEGAPLDAGLEPGAVLHLGQGWLALHVPPHLEAGRPPVTLARWGLAFELGTGERTQCFTFTRATGEVFSLGRHDLNVLRLPVGVLARRNTEFFIDWRGRLWAADCGSPGGTWRATPRERLEGWTLLAPDDVLVAGGSVSVKLVEPPRAATP